MKRIGLLILGLMLGGGVMGQDVKDEYAKWKQQRLNEYQEYSEKSRREYAEFRQRANAEYVEFMKGEWRKIKGEKPIPIPEQPKPPEPIVAPIVPDKKPIPEPIPYEEVVELPKLKPIVTVPEPIVEAPMEEIKTVMYYGTRCEVHWGEDMMFRLENLEGETLAEVWKELASERYDVLLGDCLRMKKEMKLCDWGYVELVRAVATGVMGEERNEAKLLEQYILVQSGMKVRMAESERGELVLMLPLDELVYNYLYLMIDGENYYALTNEKEGMFRVFDQAFPREQKASLSMGEQPILEMKRTEDRLFKSQRYPAMTVKLGGNKNLIDFYDKYPISSRWDLYAKASLSEGLKEVLYPKLKDVLKGKSEETKVNMLLNFVQTAFDYKTDPEQFGEERPLFADESFYYPYNDCEDRSIVFSILVKELVGLDVVLLYYPGHLATAVRFTGKVYGDYLEIEGEEYVVCDPTYIGAEVGMSMPDYKDTPARVVNLK